MRPLTEKTGKGKKFEWANEMDKSFGQIKNIISEDVLLSYPKYGTKFIVHTDASNYQMGGVISQGGKPLGFFSKSSL